ncbi:Het-C-domain-containing protein [Mycena floridula]|nr:Het-C-domain-containing protein [Mycena floridula]
MSLRLHKPFLFFYRIISLSSLFCNFGAGDIPDFAYLNDKAYRHGDIENILGEVPNGRRASGGASDGLLGFAKGLLEKAANGGKFSDADIKKVYFGNWLRDYSQAMDIAGLEKLSADTLVLVVSVLGFLSFGFATEEFQVTPERLGVYLCTEHIDNPKGYAEKEGDARQFHPKLRPPVDPRELEIDERNGMKKYMATENEGWDTSTALIRRTFTACIEFGRRAGGREGADLWETYRLLGTGLHTMEDLLAHSNWCEIALRKMGHNEVFCHVGDDTDIETPGGRAPPLVTGTFGSADFLHSLLGEATDHISQASVTSLTQKMNEASSSDSSETVENLKNLLGKFTGGDKSKMDQGEDLHQKAQAYNFNPDDVAPQEVQDQLMALLKWRDGVYRDILAKIAMIPGLSDLLDQLTNALNAYVYTILAPWLTPILQQATGVLGEASKTVIDSDDQFEVFDNPQATDPSHSLLSKDHFGLILNEPAGKIAQLVVVHSTQLIVSAWNDNSDPDRVVDQILEAFHHPYYATGRSGIQHQMFEAMEQWIGGLGPDVAQETLHALTKESVRNGKNKRLGEDGQQLEESGYGGHSHGSSQSQSRPQYSQQSQGRQSQQQSQYGRQQEQTQYGQSNDNSYGSGRDNSDAQESRHGQKKHGHHQEEQQYGQSRNEEYGDRGDSYGGGREESYGNTRTDEDSYSRQSEYEEPKPKHGHHGRRQQEDRRDGDSYGSGGYGQQQESDSYGSGGYGQQEQRRGEESYGSGGYNQSEQRRGGGNSYGQREESRQGDSYGSGGYAQQQESESYGSGGYGQQEQRRVVESYGSEGYNQPEQRRGGENSYGQREESRQGDSYGSGGYGQQEESRGGYQQRESEPRHGHHGRRDDETYGGVRDNDEGYAPSYGNDETFGAERLNIDSENQEYGSRRQNNNEYEEGY